MDEPDEKRDPNQLLTDPGPEVFVRSALLFYGVIGCVALFWRMTASDESILRPSGVSENEAFGLTAAVLIGGLLGGLSLAISELFERYTSLGDGLAEMMGESLAGLSTGDAILLALASGLAEEMFFRGALQPAVGIFWASLLFGAAHFVPKKELFVWMLFAALIGLLFGLAYEWTGNLIAPIVAHTVVNGVNLPRLARRANPSMSGPPNKR